MIPRACRLTKGEGRVATKGVTLKCSDGGVALRCDKRYVFSCAARALGLLLAMAGQLGVVGAIPARRGITTHSFFLDLERWSYEDRSLLTSSLSPDIVVNISGLGWLVELES